MTHGASSRSGSGLVGVRVPMHELPKTTASSTRPTSCGALAAPMDPSVRRVADILARRAGSVVAASAACGTHLARAAPAAETKWKTESGRKSAIDRQKRAWCGRQPGDVRLVLAQRALRDRLRAARDGAEAGGHVGCRRAVRVHGARLVVARHHDRQLAGVGARSRRHVRADAVDAAARRPLAVKRHRAGEGRRFRR
jgi:hypothetical protein